MAERPEGLWISATDRDRLRVWVKRRSGTSRKYGRKELARSNRDPLSVQSQEIVGHKAALYREHGSHRNTFGFVVMGPMQQIRCSDAKPKTEG
jgi:hypothetical protein